MVRSAVDKVMWVGRATVFLVGLIVILALMFAVASVVLGIGGPSLSGKFNQIDPATQLAVNDEAEQMLAVEPVAARRQIEYPRGYAQVNVTPTTVTVSGAKGINGVQRSTTSNSTYCFDLTFVPRVAVASANINNDSTVGTVLGSGVPSTCPTGFRDAAARPYDSDSVPNSQVNFGIVFI